MLETFRERLLPVMAVLLLAILSLAIFTFITETNLSMDDVSKNPIKKPGQSAKVEDCLSLSTSSFEAQTTGQRVSQLVEVRNDCDQDVSTKLMGAALTVRLSWNDSQTGKVYLVSTDGTQQLLSSTPQNVFIDHIPANSDQPFTVVFEPFAQENANSTSTTFSIMFESPTTQQKPPIQRDPLLLQATIHQSIFPNCLNITPDRLLLTRDSPTQSITLDARACGNIPITVALCNEPQNEYCRNGTSIGGITLSESAFTLKGEQKTIDISAFTSGSEVVPGDYGVSINAQIETDTSVSLEVPVTLDASLAPSYALQLDRYTLYLPQSSAMDEVRLFNRLFTEPVSVTACAAAWLKAIKQDDFEGILQAPPIGNPNDYFANNSNPASLDFPTEEKTAYFSDGVFSVKWSVGVHQKIFGKSLGKVIGYIDPITWVLAILKFVLYDIPAKIIRGIFEPPQDVAYFADECVPMTFDLYDHIINLSGTFAAQSQGKNDSDLVKVELLGRSDIPVVPTFSTVNLTELPYSEKYYESIALQFQNNTAVLSGDSILAITVNEHIHGKNVRHIDGKSLVDCGNDGDFSNMAIPCDERVTTRREVFHVRINPQKDAKTSGESCVTPTGLRGKTGSGALPQVSLNWSFREDGQEGITWNTCDESNPNAVYCDATQFAIMVSKRIKAIDDVLQKNNYLQGVCPLSGDKNPETKTNTANPVPDATSPTALEATRIANNTINARVTIENSSAFVADVNYLVRLMDKKINEIAHCEMGPLVVQPFSQAVGNCTLQAALSSGYYFAKGNLVANPENSSTTVDQNLVALVVAANSQACDYNKGTENVAGEPLLMDYLSVLPQGFYQPTTLAPRREDVKNLIEFDALLKKDHFNEAFVQDFATNYTTNELLDAPEWFTGTNGLGKLMKEKRFWFSRENIPESQVNEAGTYRVKIGIRLRNDWKIMGAVAGEEPFIVVSYQLKESAPSSIWYTIPLDGSVGEKSGEKRTRKAYGTDFSQDAPFAFTQSIETTRVTQSAASSNAFHRAEITYQNDIEFLNDSQNRGRLLAITRDEREQNTTNWVISPSVATPLLIKMTANQVNQSFHAYYRLFLNNQMVQPSLAWTGAGGCFDFSDQHVRSAIDNLADRPIDESDSFPPDVVGRSLDRQTVKRTGIVFAKTMVYGPTTNSAFIETISKNTAILAPYAQQVEAKNQPLNGITGMNFNQRRFDTIEGPDSLESIFELVKSKHVCVVKTPQMESYWWNTEKLMQEKGVGKSVNEFSDNLIAGQTCIGPVE